MDENDAYTSEGTRKLVDENWFPAGENAHQFWPHRK